MLDMIVYGYLMMPVNFSSDNGRLPTHRMSVATNRGVIFVTCRAVYTCTANTFNQFVRGQVAAQSLP